MNSADSDRNYRFITDTEYKDMNFEPLGTLSGTTKSRFRSTTMVNSLQHCLECQRVLVEQEGDQCQDCADRQAENEAALNRLTLEAEAAETSSSSSNDDHLYMRDVRSQSYRDATGPEGGSPSSGEAHSNHEDGSSSDTDKDKHDDYIRETPYEAARQEYRENIALQMEAGNTRRGAVNSAKLNMDKMPGRDDIIAEEEADYLSGVITYNDYSARRDERE